MTDVSTADRHIPAAAPQGFHVARATALVPYLERLGVSHVYTSPILVARRGSTHGYDVADPAA